jgi:hypothetical protein
MSVGEVSLLADAIDVLKYDPGSSGWVDWDVAPRAFDLGTDGSWCSGCLDAGLPTAMFFPSSPKFPYRGRIRLRGLCRMPLLGSYSEIRWILGAVSRGNLGSDYWPYPPN